MASIAPGEKATTMSPNRAWVRHGDERDENRRNSNGDAE
jgi:hypothetical protein